MQSSTIVLYPSLGFHSHIEMELLNIEPAPVVATMAATILHGFPLHRLDTPRGRSRPNDASGG